MVNGINLAFQFVGSFAFIVLAAAGLAIIFGIMGVINLAHGEFILVGAYGATLSHTKLGLPLVIAMPVGALAAAAFGLVVERTIISAWLPNLVGAYGATLSHTKLGLPLVIAMPVGALAAAAFGLVVERTIISAWLPNLVGQRVLGRDIVEPLYDRLADSMVVTFGLSLVVTQLARIQFGNSIDQIGTPFGSISYGAFSYAQYRLVLAGAAVAILVATYYLFTRTEYGMRARATIQDEDTARALGVDTERTYMTTFAIGSGLAGLTGALFAPVISMQPTLGNSFLVEAFVAVVVGGPSVVLGTALSGGVLGAINATFTNLFGTFFGRIALLVAAMVAIRLLPDGLTGFVERVRERREEA